MTDDRGRVENRSVVCEVLVLALLVSTLIWPTMLQLFDKWRPIADNVLGHAWPVVVVAFWGLMRDSRSLPMAPQWRLCWLPALFTVAASIAWAFASHAALGAVQQTIWPILIVGVMWVVLGGPALRVLSRALLLFLFVVPVWAVLHGFLWLTTTLAVHAILAVIGVPVTFDGNIISLPSGKIQIAAGCAGLGFFIAAVSCGAIIGYLNRASWRAYIVLLGVAGAVAMTCNWIRIVIIVFEADRTEMRTPLITESHYTFGWIVFSIGLITYCFIFGRYGFIDEKRVSIPVPRLLCRPVPLSVALGFAAVGPFAAGVSHPNTRAVSDAVLALPAGTPWQRLADTVPASWRPEYGSADVSALYRSDAYGEPMYLYANLYVSQDQSKKLISSGNSILPMNWRQLGARQHVVYSELRATDPLDSIWAVRYVYVAGDSVTSNSRFSQMMYAWQQFWNDPATGVVALAVRCGARCDDDSDDIDHVWSSAAVPLVGQIQAAGR